MAYIYQIVNDINDKVYIGKTERTLEQRFKEHCKDAFREHYEKRPLYRAMQKYGIEHFHIELIEETDIPEEREIYWINQKETYQCGYNATLGGDGKHYVDYDKIIALYKNFPNQKQVANEMNIDVSTVRKVLKMNNITIAKNPPNCKPVKQINKDNNVEIKQFYSCGEAARYLIDNGYSSAKVGTVTNKITECANNKRKSAYGYIWRFI